MAGRMSGEVCETGPRNADSSPRQVTSTSTSESTSNDVAKERPPLEERLAAKMLSYESVCFILALSFTALAALHSSPPKVSKPPAARPFFDQGSLVLDFYKGHLNAMIDRITQADYSFVMYYAPWDAESQALRHEFENVARFYHSQVFFAAINCWHPDSECRTVYNKIHSYPILMLYPSRDSGIDYRGIRTAPYMIRFLDSFMNPIVRITRKEELRELLIAHDAVVVGYFNFTRLNRTPGYREFYRTAIRSLEKDPNRELAFAVVTSASAGESHHGVYKFPSARLLMWNESLSYPEDKEWTADNILNWISGSIHQPSMWLQPPGVKAFTLAPYLRDGPVLFLFTPRNPFHTENYIYNLIREIGLQYYNCVDNMLGKDVLTGLEANRRTAMVRHLFKSQECAGLLRETVPRVRAEPDAQVVKGTVASVAIQRWINDSCCANVAMNKCSLCDSVKTITGGFEREICAADARRFVGVCKGTDVFTSAVHGARQYEKRISSYKKNYITISVHEESKESSRKVVFIRDAKQASDLDTKILHKDVDYKTSTLWKREDARSATTVRRNFLKERCRKWLAGNDYHPPLFPRDAPAARFNNSLKDSVCKTNRTLALIAIDSLHYSHFAKHLGLDVTTWRNKTAVVILDSALESQYVMHHDFSEYGLVTFVNKYTQGLLERTLRSENLRQPNRTRIKSDNNKSDNATSRIRLAELTTETFLDTILDPSKDVVVMYHSPYCGFCSAISHVYLTVAYYLAKMDHLVFVRINGDNNDLPWEYTMNRFPSILFFPAKRKEDSTVFPFSVPITIPNLLNFVLANLDGDSHVEALTNVCQAGTGEAPAKCVARIRWLCLDIIEQLLRDYRRLRRHLSHLDKEVARRRRKIIFLKLEHIRDIHFILSSVVDLGKEHKKAQLIRKKFRKYYDVVRLLDAGGPRAERRYESKAAAPITK